MHLPLDDGPCEDGFITKAVIRLAPNSAPSSPSISTSIIHGDILELLKACPETEAPLTYLVVHFVRHAESFHRAARRPGLPRSKLRDPRLTPKGKSDCLSAGKKLQETVYPDLVLTSPLTRTIGTARRLFKPSPTDCNIWAMPDLQNYDRGPNGAGLDLSTLQENYDILPGSRKSVRLDYVPQNWNDKEKGPWVTGSDHDRERVGEMYNFLSQLVRFCPRRRFEVAIVTHGSVLKDFFEGFKGYDSDECYTHGLYYKSVAFELAQNIFRDLTEGELSSSRLAAASKLQKQLKVPEAKHIAPSLQNNICDTVMGDEETELPTVGEIQGSMKNLQDKAALKLGLPDNDLPIPILHAVAEYTETAVDRFHKPHAQKPLEPVLDSRLKKGQVQYKVPWKHYGGDKKWHPASKLVGAREWQAAEEFHILHPDKPDERVVESIIDSRMLHRRLQYAVKFKNIPPSGIWYMAKAFKLKFKLKNADEAGEEFHKLCPDKPNGGAKRRSARLKGGLS